MSRCLKATALLGLLTALISGVLFWRGRLHYPEIAFELAVLQKPANEQSLYGQFYFDNGQGLSEQDSVCVPYRWDSGQGYTLYQIKIPSRARIGLLRFDPLAEDGAVKIRNMRVKKYVWEDLRPTWGFLRARHSIEGLSTLPDGGLLVKMKGGDPQLTVTDHLDSAVRVTKTRALTVFFQSLLLALAIFSAGFFAARKLREASRLTWADMNGPEPLNLFVWLPALFAAAYTDYTFVSFLPVSTKAAFCLALSSALLHSLLLACGLMILVNLSRKLFPRSVPSLIESCVLLACVVYYIDCLYYRIQGSHLNTAWGIVFWGGWRQAGFILHATGIPPSALRLYAFAVIAAIGGSLGLAGLGNRKAARSPVRLSASRLLACAAAFLLLIGAEQYLSRFYKTPKLWAQERSTLPFYLPLIRVHDSIVTMKVRIRPFENKGRLVADFVPKGTPPKGGSNIFIFVIESLRADFVSPEIAPNLAAFRQGAVSGMDTVSNSNATHHCWYALFNSDYPLFWNDYRTLPDIQGSAILEIFKKAGYHIRAFAVPIDIDYFDYKSLIYGTGGRLADEFYLTDEGTPYPAQTDLQITENFERFYRHSRAGKNLTIVYLDSTHHPYFWPQNVTARFKPFVPDFDYTRTNYSIEQVGEIRNSYKNALAYEDMLMGRMFRTLKAARVYKDAAIAILGDHGEEFMEHGHLAHSSTLFNEQTRIFLALKLPGVDRSTVHPPVFSEMNVLPTLLDYAGLYAGTEGLFDGRSILGPSIRNQYALLSGVYGALVPYQFSLYNGRYKLFFSLDRNQPLASTTLSFREIYDREDRPFVPGVGSWGDYHSFIEKEFLPYLKDISFLALEGK